MTILFLSITFLCIYLGIQKIFFYFCLSATLINKNKPNIYMKTFTHLLCVLILSIVLFACNNAHFLKEESYRNQVAQDFEQKKQALPHGDLFAIFADSI